MAVGTHPFPTAMQAFFVSMLVVAVGEIGDKTQLLALMLAARLKKPVPIVIGIFVATLLNHTLAGLAGAWVRDVVPPRYLRWILAASFFAVALWALRPDSIDTDSDARQTRYGAFAITVLAFFLAEIGDKTQVATVMLAAQFGNQLGNLAAVVAGTTLGMLIADVPVVFLGGALARKVPLTMIRWVAASLFALLGIATLIVPALDGSPV